MACYKPISAYRLRGERGVSFKHTEDSHEIQLPCGQCIGCRLERSRQWAVRMVNEAQMHDENSFLTLTYKVVPDDLSVHVEHFQDFMKKLRSRLSPKRIRFFHCGEYGEHCVECDLPRNKCRCCEFVGQLARPHYHCIVFGFSFPDRVYYKSVNGCRYFQSVFLDSVWNRGMSVVGDVTFESCAYVARYVTKKINGEKAFDHYWSLDRRTGEVVPIVPEYCTMSRRPGIGASWFKKFGQEVVSSDSVVVRGREMKPPRFYESMYDEIELEAVKGERECASHKRDFDSTPDRLRVREVCKVAQVDFLKRGYEHEV